MTININNQPKEIASHHSLATVLSILDMPSKGVAIAINQTIIAKQNWENTALKENDNVMIIQATQGG